MSTIEQRIRSGEARIVDVRSPAEFMGGHVAGSINVPMQEVAERLEELKSMNDIILCCASGNRSAQVTSYLKSHGVKCENGGSWMAVNF